MYLVRLRNAAGTARELWIRARNSDAAIRNALRETESSHPAQGWRPEFVL